MEKPIFVYVTHINATPEKVWEALTRPEFTRQYWGGRQIQSDWTKGASVKFIKPDGGVDLKGEVLEADPPRRLSYTWACPAIFGGPPENPTRVTFEIAVTLGVTKLTVTHDGFEPGSKLFVEINKGWQAILSNLKTLLETGKPLPFTHQC
jgi:uncharacterized protein YndB with AHSA1/START domain